MEENQSSGTGQAPSTNSTSTHSGRKKVKNMGWLSIISVGLLITGAILILALVIKSVVGGPIRERKYVDEDKLQAIFLNNGQVYFGKITNLNDRYVRVGNVYYLRQNQSPQPEQNTDTSANSNLSLVKLGCEVHGPDDEMLINKDQVSFWENLKSDGQVAKAVAKFVSENPQGQQCKTT